MDGLGPPSIDGQVTRLGWHLYETVVSSIIKGSRRGRCLILPHSAIAAIRVPLMAFSRSLDAKAMSEYVTRHFAWERRGIAFPPSSLPKDFQTLCPDFELAVAKEATEYYEFPELPQPIFYAMLLNKAERLGVLQGQALRSLELALTELRWSAFESASCPPRSLPEDFHILCPRFLLSEVWGAVADFELPKIVQATFYTMLLNKVVELGVVLEFTAESMKSSLIGLRWSTFEVWMDCVDHALREAHFIGRLMKWRSVVPKTAKRRALGRPAP
ncbi:hypothetical protein Cgig2_026217 [Carnegiea gigantea]|uniref:Uncharacterized protein n=1 Tax=Carnegiea gigantea TaxID=171969 RepID=A0A9Q1QKG7_9CARY|nr:hypothetical protein Cgig2_026217 [Carnegiea gigantea]